MNSSRAIKEDSSPKSHRESIKPFSLLSFLFLNGIIVASLFSLGATLEGTIKSKFSLNFMDASHTIDHWIEAGWHKKNLKSSDPSSDAEFLRRVSIDIIGQIPTATQVSEFLQDTRPNKRQLKIDELLNNKLYGDNWSNIWAKWLVGREVRIKFVRPTELKNWLSQTFNNNTPYDQFVTSLIAADGSTEDNPAAYYIARYEAKPEDLAGNVAKLFMGKQIQCAQCHNHPYEPIKQEDFWAMAAFFTRTKVRPVKEGKKVIGAEIFDRPRGEVYIPNKNPKKPIYPKFITGETIDNGFMTKRREELAKLVISSNDPYFAKEIVNRIWDHFMGRGIVEPIDDFSYDNQPTHPELLNFLAQDFIRHDYDLKYLIRVITNSKIYQLSSEATENNRKDIKYYTHAYLRPMTAEQLFYSLLQSTGIEEVRKFYNPEQLDRMKEGYLRKFVFIFDNDEMEEDESFQGTIPQALMLLNGQLVNLGIRARPKGTLGTILQNSHSDSERVDWLYLATLSRYPTPEERKECLDYIQKYGAHKRADENSNPRLYVNAQKNLEIAQANRPNRERLQQFQQRFANRPGQFEIFRNNQAYEDIFWALLNSPEFILNH